MSWFVIENRFAATDFGDNGIDDGDNGDEKHSCQVKSLNKGEQKYHKF